jgi:hypothetical protein
MIKRPAQSFLLLLLLNIFCCFCFFYPILGSMNTSMMTLCCDGIKNYFCYLYFIQYDCGTHFTGMNYPFGENILFTDNMPALAWSIAKLKILFPGIVKYCLVLLHSTFLVSYFLCSYYLHKILHLFNVKGWWAIGSAVFIAYFSPQFFRLTGHFSLALVCFFPMVIYWIMQYNRSRKWKYLLFLFCGTTLFTFLHVYYLAFALVLVTAYCFSFWLVQRKTLRRKVVHTIPLLISIGMAALALKGYLTFTDTVTDRPATPNGYAYAVATWQDVLTSAYNFIGANGFSWLLGGSSRWSEGYAYIGLITILVLLFLLYRLVRGMFLRLAKSRKIPMHPIRSYRVWLITALLLLLYAMGAPFIWGMDFLLDWFPALKQFRSVGRFAWIFYYLSSVYAAIFFYRLFQYWRNCNYHTLSNIVMLLVVVVWLIEWNGYGQQLRTECSSAKDHYNRFYAKEITSWPVWLKRHSYTPQAFQGIIGLPYVHIGSEKTGVQEDYNNVILQGAMIACTTGLPMTDVMMSRTSWSQTFANLPLIDGPLTPKHIVDQFDDKPFLLFVTPGVSLSPGERSLINQAQFIGKKDEIALYSLNLKMVAQKEVAYADSLNDLVALRTTKEGLLDNTCAFTYSNHFDNNIYQTAFAGRGALIADTQQMRLISTIPVTHVTNDTVFIISAWFQCYNNSPRMPGIVFRQYDNRNELRVEGEVTAAKSTYVIGDWFKAEQVITIGSDVSKLEVYVQGAGKSFKAADELLLYPATGVYFYKAGNTGILLNNRPVKSGR